MARNTASRGLLFTVTIRLPDIVTRWLPLIKGLSGQNGRRCPRRRCGGRSLADASCGFPLRLAFRVHQERRRLVADEVLELPAELFERDANSGGKLRELVRIVEIVMAQADHVAACDRVPGGMRIDEPDAGPPRLAVEQRGERDGHEVAALHRDHGRIPA